MLSSLNLSLLALKGHYSSYLAITLTVSLSPNYKYLSGFCRYRVIRAIFLVFLSCILSHSTLHYCSGQRFECVVCFISKHWTWYPSIRFAVCHNIWKCNYLNTKIKLGDFFLTFFLCCYMRVAYEKWLLMLLEICQPFVYTYLRQIWRQPSLAQRSDIKVWYKGVFAVPEVFLAARNRDVKKISFFHSFWPMDILQSNQLICWIYLTHMKTIFFIQSFSSRPLSDFQPRYKSVRHQWDKNRLKLR